MTFSRAFLLFLLVGITTSATAGDSQANSATSPTSTDNQVFGLANTNSNQSILRNLTSPFSRPDANSGALQLRNPQLGIDTRAGTESRANASADVCYTMRSYKVKRTERLDDSQSGVRGYSICEMASSYRLRSADSKAQQRVRLK
jgi:hypothetical protein